MSVPLVQRVQKRRQALREAGLRPLQIWVPDTRKSGFSEMCRQQSRRVAAADLVDGDLQEFMQAAFADLDKTAK